MPQSAAVITFHPVPCFLIIVLNPKNLVRVLTPIHFSSRCSVQPTPTPDLITVDPILQSFLEAHHGVWSEGFMVYEPCGLLPQS